jgi:predicted ferric reductase
MLHPPAILKHKGSFAMLVMAILSVCYFIWFTCSLEGVGLIKFELFGSLTWWVFQALILISLIAINISYKLHKSAIPLIIGFLSAVIIFHAYHIEQDKNWQIEMAVGMLGFTIASIINVRKVKQSIKTDEKGLK